MAYLRRSIGTVTGRTLDTPTITTAVMSNPTGLDTTDVGIPNVENTALSTWAGTSNITTLGTFSASAVIDGHLKGQTGTGESHSMFSNYTSTTGVAHGSTWTFEVWKGPVSTGYHIWLAWQVSSPSSGLNYSCGRTGFNHNGVNLYEYGRDANIGAHLSNPTFNHNNSTGVCSAVITNNAGYTMNQPVDWSCMIVSNREILAPDN